MRHRMNAPLHLLFRNLNGEKSFRNWLSDIKLVLSNPMAVLLLLFYATASGYSAMIATKLEQLMCSQVTYLSLALRISMKM